LLFFLRAAFDLEMFDRILSLLSPARSFLQRGAPAYGEAFKLLDPALGLFSQPQNLLFFFFGELRPSDFLNRHGDEVD